MSLHIVEKRCQPVVFYGYVAVQQHRVAVAGLAQRAVISGGEAEVFIEGENGDIRKVAAQQSEGSVGRAVVGHYDVGYPARSEAVDRRQKLAEKFLTVPVQYDYGNRFFHSFEGRLTK